MNGTRGQAARLCPVCESVVETDLAQCPGCLADLSSLDPTTPSGVDATGLDSRQRAELAELRASYGRWLVVFVVSLVSGMILLATLAMYLGPDRTAALAAAWALTTGVAVSYASILSIRYSKLQKVGSERLAGLRQSARKLPASPSSLDWLRPGERATSTGPVGVFPNDPRHQVMRNVGLSFLVAFALLGAICLTFILLEPASDRLVGALVISATLVVAGLVTGGRSQRAYRLSIPDHIDVYSDRVEGRFPSTSQSDGLGARRTFPFSGVGSIVMRTTWSRLACVKTGSAATTKVIWFLTDENARRVASSWEAWRKREGLAVYKRDAEGAPLKRVA